MWCPQSDSPKRIRDQLQLRTISCGRNSVSWAWTCLRVECKCVLLCLRPGESVFKVHFFTPNFSPPGAGGCYHIKICQCFGEHVTQHDPPLIFDLYRDPSESHPLTPATEPRYAEILEQTAAAVERHRGARSGKQVAGDSDANSVQSQMTWEKILWRPWLQPCCGTFPFCGCKEDAISI